MTSDVPHFPGLSASFSAETAQKQELRASKSDRPAPFSLRLSRDERAYLEEQAGGRPLGAYIRAQLLGPRAAKRRAQRRPKVGNKQVAQVLAELGRSHLSSNLNQLARSVHTGTLDVSRDVEQELQDACAAVLAMREALFIALGLKAGTHVSSPDQDGGAA